MHHFALLLLLSASDGPRDVAAAILTLTTFRLLVSVVACPTLATATGLVAKLAAV